MDWVAKILLRAFENWFAESRLAEKNLEREIDEASIIFRRSITETQLYLGHLLRTDERDLEREANLARLWSDASRETRKINRNVSQSAFAFSEYWANPDISPFEITDKLKGKIKRIYKDGIMSRLVDFE